MADAKPLPLNDQLCFSLYSASLAVNRLFKPMLDEMGVTYPQYLVLNALGDTDGLTVGMIAERLSLESSTITPTVKRLEQAQLVERRRSTSDERQVHVWLTDSGRRLFLNSRCLGETLIASAGMPKQEVKALNAKVRALIVALEEHDVPA
jgi:DNA-binding MarR family transcriptional regulator